jgi:hypothetical protein
MAKWTEWLTHNPKQWLMPALVLLMATGILVLTTGNWNA